MVFEEKMETVRPRSCWSTSRRLTVCGSFQAVGDDTTRFDCLMKVKYPMRKAATGTYAGGPSGVRNCMSRKRSVGDRGGACDLGRWCVLLRPFFICAVSRESNSSALPPTSATQALAPDMILFIVPRDSCLLAKCEMNWSISYWSGLWGCRWWFTMNDTYMAACLSLFLRVPCVRPSLYRAIMRVCSLMSNSEVNDHKSLVNLSIVCVIRMRSRPRRRHCSFIMLFAWGERCARLRASANTNSLPGL